MPTYNRFNLNAVSSDGTYIYDDTGAKYLDFTSGIGVCSIGHNDDGFKTAIKTQLDKLTHVSNLYYNYAGIEFAEKLCKKTKYDKVFFANSGAEANECAIKLARKYSHDKYGDGRHNIITLNNSFHGRTLTTLSATAQPNMHMHFSPFSEGFIFCDPNNFDSILNKNDSSVCAIMLEFIQGEGGVIPLDRNFIIKLFEYAKKNDILMIADEVQTGAGRTGKYLCSEHYNVFPDITTMAKGIGGGLPIGACLCTKELSDTMSVGTHGSTFGGNPVVCAGASYVIDKMNTSFLYNVEKKGDYLFNKLIELDGVKKVNSKGLMFGIVPDYTKLKITARQFSEKCLKHHLMLLTAKENIRLLPPLTVSFEEIDEACSIIKNVLNEFIN
jgi:acetylornithine and succinylornithine aminotransferases